MRILKSTIVWAVLFAVITHTTILIIISLAWMIEDRPIERLEEECVKEDTTSVVSSRTQTQTTWNDFLSAVIHVESSGNDSAYNKSEDAVGCLQIRPIMVREVNRNLRKWNAPFSYTLEDRWSREKSIEMFEIMAEQIPCCEDQEFMEFAEVVARKWNGGGRGHLKESTIAYWQKIKTKINLDSK